MILDNEMKLCDSVDVSQTQIDYSSSIDLTVSPDMGTGEQLVAMIVIESYTAGSSTSTEFDIVTSSTADLTTSPAVVGTRTLGAARIEQRDLGAGGTKQAIIVRINPDQEEITSVSSVDERYIGIQFNHATATPTDMTVTAYFITNYQSDPTLAHHASGFIIA